MPRSEAAIAAGSAERVSALRTGAEGGIRMAVSAPSSNQWSSSLSALRDSAVSTEITDFPASTSIQSSAVCPSTAGGAPNI
eukprot:scaffold124261_cov46-Tisochrysis_lutea.AAC.1